MPYVLIADDEIIQRTLVRETLAFDPSLQFIETGNGITALELIQTMRPSLAILDILMPRMGGIEVCQIVKCDPILNTLPVILLTAADDQGNRVLAKDACCDLYVIKPFEPSELISKVQRLLKAALNGGA
jgi:CheY-like chemotaxis protein